jgi:RHS repeat-associated protein
MGRRVKKTVYVYGSGSWAEENATLYVYDGWNLIQELNGSGNVQKSYVNGLDLSQSLQGAGGIGGILAVVDGTNVYLYSYDANGNVGQVINSADGSIAANYQYDPFGKTISATGTYANVNPFRFSTKYHDDETDLVYYGYRYYSPELGRLINRDPIVSLYHNAKDSDVREEAKLKAALYAYQYTLNNPLTFVDPFGLDTMLIIIGDEFEGSSMFQSAAAMAAKKYKESQYYNEGCDAVVTVNLTGAKDNAAMQVQQALNKVKGIRFFLYYGHSSSKYIYLTNTSGYGANISANGSSKQFGDKYNSIAVTSLSTINITKHAVGGFYSCQAGGEIAGAFANHFGIPFEASPEYVNYSDDGQPFIKIWGKSDFWRLRTGGWKWYGGSPAGRSRADYPRDFSWGEDAARKAGY